MKKINICIVFMFISLLIFGDQIKWDNVNNYLKSIHRVNDIEEVIINGKSSGYILKKDSIFNYTTPDLFLQFDDLKKTENNSIINNNYSFIQSNYSVREKDAFSGTSAFFYKENHSIELEGNSNSIFTAGNIIDSFTISFWVYSHKITGNESIMKIGAHYYSQNKDNVEEQSIHCLIDEGFVTWNFKNVFHFKGLEDTKQFSLRALNRILPLQWSKVELVYDSHEGTIEIKVNGMQSAIAMTTDNGKRTGMPLSLYFASSNRCIISIGHGFVGAIDDFSISRGVIKTNEEIYKASEGELVSQIIQLSEHPVLLKSVDFDHTINDPYAELEYFIRFSDEPFCYENMMSQKTLPWLPLNNDLINDIRTHFVQWKVVFRAGMGKSSSPVFRGLTLHYDEEQPPSAPRGVKAFSKNNEVHIKWLPNSERDVKGYKIYYGTKPQVYFGDEALDGESPVVVGKTNEWVLKGVSSNTLYYISVTAYNDVKATHESLFSDEVIIRVR